MHVDYVQEIRSINVLPRFSIDHGGRVDNINEYLDRLIKRTCYELRGPSSKHYEVCLLYQRPWGYVRRFSDSWYAADSLTDNERASK